MQQDQRLDALRETIERWITDSQSNYVQAQQQQVFATARGRAPPDHDAIAEVSRRLQELSTTLKSLESRICATSEGHAILKSLYFSTFRLRHDAIPKAHTHTFNWIFKDKTPNNLRAIKFAEWLSTQNGIFWIRGKAGSGKSTLMKFICQHEQTRSQLKTWAGSGELVVAEYFFWNSGTQLQKSQEGLLRSILYEILQTSPALARRMVSELAPTHGLALSAHGDSDFWTLEQLTRVYNGLMLSENTVKFCFFIDGLDEFKGGSFELVRTIRELSNYPSVKICVSSRPWAEFVNAFGRDNPWHIRLEDFTENDIRAYVHDRFNESEQFQLLVDRNRQSQRQNEIDSGYEELKNQVVRRAQGVFLWVFLATRSLLQGAQYEDTLIEMSQRLDTFPPDLYDYFKYMLKDVPHFYRRQTARIFRMAVAADEALPMLAYSIADEIDKSPRFALEMAAHEMSPDEIIIKGREMHSRLDARCKGLLEIPSASSWETDPKYNTRIDFLHRTVKEFLNNSVEVQDLFDQHLGSDFEPFSLICHSLLGYIKSGNHCALVKACYHYYSLMEPIGPLARIFEFAAHIQADRKDTAAIHGVFESLLRDVPWIISSPTYLLGFMVQCRLEQAIILFHESIKPPFSKWEQSPLCYTLYQGGQPRPIVEMARLLLSLDMDPNQIDGFETIWTRFLEEAARHEYSASKLREVTPEIADCVGLLLEYGARTDAKVFISAERLSEESRKSFGCSKEKSSVPRMLHLQARDVIHILFGRSQAKELLARSRTIIGRRSRKNRFLRYVSCLYG